MNAQRFIELVEAYGADTAQWPEAERDAARAYVEANPQQAEEALAPARQLDDLMDTAQKELADTSLLAARILKAAHQTNVVGKPANDMIDRPALLSRRQPAWRSIAATFVITTGVGFAMGQSAAAKSALIAEAEALLTLTLDDPFESANLWEDL